MNVLILNWRDPKNPKSGGAEIVTQEHAKAWVKAGHSVIWFTSHFKNAKKEEIIDGVKVIRRGNALSVYLFAPFFYFFSKNTFDVVIDEIHGIPFFTPLYVKKARKIAFIHEVAGEIWDYMYPFPVNKIGKLLEQVYFRLYKNIPFWTDADSTIDDLQEKGIDRTNCIAINCPASNPIVSKFPEKEKNPTFIFVSRVVRMKGVEDVIDAFYHIQKTLPHAKLWVVGDGDQKYLQELHAQAGRHGILDKVTFWGRVSNAKKLTLLGKSHIELLSIKVHAGWCLVVIEGASQGTPSVVYRVSGVCDAVKDKKTGIVVEKNSPEEMAKEAVALLQDKKTYKRYQMQGLLWAKSLTWEKTTEQSLTLLRTVTERL